MINILDFGAVGDGKTNATTAIQKAIDECRKNGGGSVFVPAGKYIVASLQLCSNLHFVFETGAFFYGSTNIDDFNKREEVDYPLYQDVSHSYFQRSMFFAEGCSNIVFTGFGTIDMQEVWEKTPVKGASEWGNHRGCKIFAFKNCTDIVLRDMKLLHSTDIAVYFAGCEYVKVSHLTLDVNIDGISPDCCNHVTISDCFVRSGDDAIVLKSSYALNEKRLCQNICVTNCTVSSRCNAIKLGTESNGGFKNIVVSNCTVYNTYMAGVALEITDGGEMDGITVTNIAMKNVGTPLFVILSDRGRGPEGTKIGSIRNITISNIAATGPYDEEWYAPRITTMWESGQLCRTPVVTSNITGQPDKKIENIVLSNISLTVEGGGTEEYRKIVPPEITKNYPQSYSLGMVLPASGIYFRHIKNLKLSNICIDTIYEDKRETIVFEDVENLNVT